MNLRRKRGIDSKAGARSNEALHGRRQACGGWLCPSLFTLRNSVLENELGMSVSFTQDIIMRSKSK